MDINEAKELVIQAGEKLVRSGLIARTWGNISCRIDQNHFAITPSGRDYLSLTPEQIVVVEIEDGSYNGNIKPSSEKGIHVEVYKLNPEINFIIHTHQQNASVVSALGLDSIEVADEFFYLGGQVICAPYALPGTKKLHRNVSDAVVRSRGKAVIMKNHGALCIGENYQEAFMVASQLEDACDRFVKEQYLKVSGQTDFDPYQMRSFALSRLRRKDKIDEDCIPGHDYQSQRTQKGFILYQTPGEIIEVGLEGSDTPLSQEAEIHRSIYNKYKNINHIIHANTPDFMTVSCAGINLRPLLDDFAQIAGTLVKNVESDTARIVAALRRCSVVFVCNNGALCCGNSEQDAVAVRMVTEKACKALIAASFIGEIKPINRLECSLMRFVYLKKYSKQANNKL
ncbi:MAG: class II aldolase/adducin family protein [Clostridia bacterium]|nr:class II aldolase/adducin family protein [Clostridia bacterium]